MTTDLRAAVVTAIAIFVLPLSVSEAASTNSDDLLEYIPVDSPYVFATTKPMPDDVAEKFERLVDESLAAYRAMIREAMANESTENGGENQVEQYEELIEEILGLMSIEGIRGLGIERDSAWAIYGNGLIPVLRFGLSDANLFDAAVVRLEEKSGQEFEVGEADGESYKYVSFGPVKLLVATVHDQAVITAVPSKFEESQVSLALGLSKPRKSIKKSKTINEINRKYGFSEFATGFFDNMRIAEILTGDATGLDKELFETIGFEAPNLSDVCRSETMGLVAIAPRIVVGYSLLTPSNIDGKMVVELRDDIAQGLATLPAPVPGLGIDAGGFLSFGFSLNPLKAREFFEARLDAMEEEPFECETFEGLQASVENGRELLNQPIPPVAYGFRGFVANILDVSGIDLMAGEPPESVDATLMFAVDNAESLLMMASLLDPEIEALNLLPDGQPVKLDMPQISEFAEEAYAALSENALSIALGDDAAANASNILQADSADPAPFMSISIDSARYYSMIGNAMLLQDPDEEKEQIPLAFRESMRDLMIATGELYERMSAIVLFTGRGIEIESRTVLSD